MPPNTPWSYPNSIKAIPQQMVMPTVRRWSCGMNLEDMIMRVSNENRHKASPLVYRIKLPFIS